MNASLLENVKNFDDNKKFKIEIDKTITLLQKFRIKYPFVKKPDLINTLTPDDIFNESAGNVGDFFHWIEFYLKEIGYLSHMYSEVHRNIRNQLDEFKDLLHIVVDKNKSIAQKVNAPWQEISRLGGDKHIAKKIIFCFNYENNCVLPIFKTEDLIYFYRITTDHPNFPDRYSRMSLGEKYQFLTSELIKNKEKVSKIKPWDLVYFSRFLYETYPPPRSITSHITSKERQKNNEEKREKQRQYGDFVELLNKLRKNDKISDVERRIYDNNWRNQHNNRDLLMKELERKMGTQSAK